MAVKPLGGHKGIGVTAGVQDADELAAAFARAGGEQADVIVETSLEPAATSACSASTAASSPPSSGGRPGSRATACPPSSS